MKTLIQTSKVLILSIAVLTAVSYVQAEWSNPKQAPTGGNVEAPINVSESNQNKNGGFTASALVGGVITSPEYCIGSSSDNLDCITAWPGGGGDSGGGDVNDNNSDESVVSDSDKYLTGQFCGYIRSINQTGTTNALGDYSIPCTIDSIDYHPGITECKYLGLTFNESRSMQGQCTSSRKLGCPSGFQASSLGSVGFETINFRGDTVGATGYTCVKQ